MYVCMYVCICTDICMDECMMPCMHDSNVIYPPLISTEIHQHLAPLPLHVLLGTTKKAMDIISEMCVTLVLKTGCVRERLDVECKR